MHVHIVQLLTKNHENEVSVHSSLTFLYWNEYCIQGIFSPFYFGPFHLPCQLADLRLGNFSANSYHACT